MFQLHAHKALLSIFLWHLWDPLFDKVDKVMLNGVDVRSRWKYGWLSAWDTQKGKGNDGWSGNNRTADKIRPGNSALLLWSQFNSLLGRSGAAFIMFFRFFFLFKKFTFSMSHNEHYLVFHACICVSQVRLSLSLVLLSIFRLKSYQEYSEIYGE